MSAIVNCLHPDDRGPSRHGFNGSLAPGMSRWKDNSRQVTGRVGTMSERDSRQDGMVVGSGPLRPPAKRRNRSGRPWRGRAGPGGWHEPVRVIPHFCCCYLVTFQNSIESIICYSDKRMTEA